MSDLVVTLTACAHLYSPVIPQDTHFNPKCEQGDS